MERIIKKLECHGVYTLQVKNESEYIQKINEYLSIFYGVKNPSFVNADYFGINELDINNDEVLIYLVDVLIAIEESAVFVMNKDYVGAINKMSGKVYFALVFNNKSIVENIELAQYRLAESSGPKQNILAFLQPVEMNNKCIVLYIEE